MKDDVEPDLIGEEEPVLELRLDRLSERRALHPTRREGNRREFEPVLPIAEHWAQACVRALSLVLEGLV